MNINDYEARQIIPRWYPFEMALYLGEVLPNSKPVNYRNKFTSYLEKEIDWMRNIKTLSSALDFVGTALVVNDFNNDNAVKASEFILDNEKKISSLAIQLAKRYVNEEKKISNFSLSDDNNCRNNIVRIKAALKMYPYNSIAWADMAYYYAVLGQNAKSDKCMFIAVNYSPDNRYILRSAARLYLHLHDPEKALYYLRKSENTRYDPWLLSSEISISEAFDIKTKNIKTAKYFLTKVDDLPSKDLAELFGTIATLEAKSGANNKAKKLFKNALIDPNENTVAQAFWMSPQIGLHVDLSNKAEASFEADGRYYFSIGNYKDALESTIKWLKFQPFCSHPVISASYITGVCLNDYNRSIQIIKDYGNHFIEKDFFVKNNYIFSLASLGRISEAEKLLDSINIGSLQNNEKATLLATEGLIKYRKNLIDEGRKLYEDAIENFKILKDEKRTVLASYFLSREEKRIGNDNILLSEKISKSAKRLGLNELIPKSNIKE